MSVLIKSQECPCCGRYTDRTASLKGGGGSKKGDAVICVGCGAINTINDAGALIVVPDAEVLHASYAEARRVSKRVRIARGIDPR